MKWIKLCVESNTIPSDKKSINDSFNKDVSDEKFIPTEEFARNVYDKVNREFFLNYMPSNVEFKIKNTIRGGEFGAAFGNKYTIRGKTFVSDFKLVLNSSVIMSIHDWIGVVIHEMIHILDYNEHPEHYMNKEYNPHGEWFLEQGKRFEKHGFHVEEFYRGDYKMDTENPSVAKMVNRDLFIKIGETKSGYSKIIKVLRKNRDNVLKCLKKRGLESVVILKSSNPNAVQIPVTSMKALSSDRPFTSFVVDDEFNDSFGPFEEDEGVNLSDVVSEGSGDGEYDEELDTIRSIKGVIMARRISKNAIQFGVA